MEPIYFLVETRNGVLSTSLCYERLPTEYQGKRAKENGLVYYRRIDDQPHLCDRSRDELFHIWQASGELPIKEEIPLDNETNNDPHFIVSEIIKNWQGGVEIDEIPAIGQQFEAVLNYNHERGYHLFEWKYTMTMTGSDSMVETIIAIFKKNAE